MVTLFSLLMDVKGEKAVERVNVIKKMNIQLQNCAQVNLKKRITAGSYCSIPAH